MTTIVGNDHHCCRYEGTGRSLSLKLIEQLRQQSGVGGASSELCSQWLLLKICQENIFAISLHLLLLCWRKKKFVQQIFCPVLMLHQRAVATFTTSAKFHDYKDIYM